MGNELQMFITFLLQALSLQRLNPAPFITCSVKKPTGLETKIHHEPHPLLSLFHFLSLCLIKKINTWILHSICFLFFFFLNEFQPETSAVRLGVTKFDVTFSVQDHQLLILPICCQLVLQAKIKGQKEGRMSNTPTAKGRQYS